MLLVRIGDWIAQIGSRILEKNMQKKKKNYALTLAEGSLKFQGINWQ